jgi:glutathione-specific gamma-glutamylcyclotransferase
MQRAPAQTSGPANPWVFGYGSLMWNPGFPYLRAAPASLHGFHRSLCLYSHQYRGTPAKPGLVFGLDRGGSCRGMVFEVDVTYWPETLTYLRQREQLTNVYVETTKRVHAAGLHEPVEALCFLVNRQHAQYAGELTPENILKFIKQGHGEMGPCEEYVRYTVEHLRQLNIRDRRLERIAGLLESH